jgi:hypothetical protein
MARQHGVTDWTTKRFVIDSGAVYKNYGETDQVLLGATRGGNTFTIEQEIRDMPVDGAKGPMMGARRIIKVTAKLTANFVEISPDILQLALPGSSAADYPDTGSTHTEITRALQLSLADYSTNITLVGEVSGVDGKYIECGILNALADGNLEMAMADGDEAAPSITFTAHFDPTDLDTEPWFIRFPDVTTED